MSMRIDPSPHFPACSSTDTKALPGRGGDGLLPFAAVIWARAYAGHECEPPSAAPVPPRPFLRAPRHTVITHLSRSRSIYLYIYLDTSIFPEHPPPHSTFHIPLWIPDIAARHRARDAALVTRRLGRGDGRACERYLTGAVPLSPQYLSLPLPIVLPRLCDQVHSLPYRVSIDGRAYVTE